MILDDDEEYVIATATPLAVVLKVTKDVDLAIDIMQALLAAAEDITPAGFTPGIVFSREYGIIFNALMVELEEDFGEVQ